MDWFEKRDRVPADYADYGGAGGDQFYKGSDNPYRAKLEAMYGPADEMETAAKWYEYLEERREERRREALAQEFGITYLPGNT